MIWFLKIPFTIYMDTSEMYGLSSEKINETCLEDQDQPETRITVFV